MVGEKTPFYCYDKKSIDRIHKHYPDIKLIMILREPIQRAYSQWNMIQQRKSHPLKNKPFRMVVEKNLSDSSEKASCYDVVQRGYYDEQIEYVLTKFPKKNLYIGIAEEIRENKAEQYGKIFNFLGVPMLESFETDLDRHVRKYREPMKQEDKEYLYKIYRPHVEKVYSLLGRKVESWERYYKTVRTRKLRDRIQICS